MFSISLRSIFLPWFTFTVLFRSKGKNKIRIISRHIFFSHFEGKTQPPQHMLNKILTLAEFLAFFEFFVSPHSNHHTNIQTPYTQKHHLHPCPYTAHASTTYISTLTMALQNSPSPTFQSHPTQLTTRSLTANTNCLKNKNNLKNSICAM